MKLKEFEKEKILYAYLFMRESAKDVNITFDIPDFDRVVDITYIIENTPSFNNKDNYKIAKQFSGFYSKLPVFSSDNLSNSNNGKPMFDITIINDDCIELTAYILNSQIIDKKLFGDYLEKIVAFYGEKWCADEHTVLTEPNLITTVYKIRFWWD